MAVSLVNPDGAACTDAMAVQEQHDFPYPLARLPCPGDPMLALWSNPIDQLQVGGFVFNRGQDLGAKPFHQTLGEDGADAFHHPAPEVFLNALRSAWSDGPQRRGFELEAVLFVAEPNTLRGNPFSRAHGGQCPDDGHNITVPGSLHPQNAETRVLVEICDSFDEPINSIGTGSLARGQQLLTHKRHSRMRDR